jgi:hypothetical protein
MISPPLTLAERITAGLLAVICVLLGLLLYALAAPESPKSSKGWFRITTPTSQVYYTQKYSIGSSGVLHFLNGRGEPCVAHGNYFIQEASQEERDTPGK